MVMWFAQKGRLRLLELQKDPNLDMGHLKMRDSVSPAFEAELRQAPWPAACVGGCWGPKVVESHGGLLVLVFVSHLVGTFSRSWTQFGSAWALMRGGW